MGKGINLANLLTFGGVGAKMKGRIEKGSLGKWKKFLKCLA